MKDFIPTNGQFSMMTLPYEALGDVISVQTLSFHHGKHLQAYVDNLNKLLPGSGLENLPLSEVVRKAQGGLFNNAGQVLNHTLYFEQFSPAPKPMSAQFAALLEKNFGSVDAFKQEFESYVAAHILPEQQQPVIKVEAEIRLSDITPQFFRILQCLEPYGPGNPRPVFVTRNMINYRYTKRVGKMGEHLKLDVTDQTAYITGIAFGKGDFATYFQNGYAADVCYELEENNFGGATTIQMQVLDIKKKE
jgi:hypothetical protein